MRRPDVYRTVDDLIREAADLPLRDAAYALWRQKSAFERLEGRTWPVRDRSTPEAREKADREFVAEMKYEHDFAQDGPTFDRLKRAHPNVDDLQLKQAILAAVKFDDDCFKYYALGREYSEKVDFAVAQAARDNPDYLETTYRDAHNWVGFNMK
jgi:hypothetical protein